MSKETQDEVDGNSSDSDDYYELMQAHADHKYEYESNGSGVGQEDSWAAADNSEIGR
jgi:hypothetical protein